MTKVNHSVAEIWTEGKTDWMLIKKAQEALGIDLNVSYHEFEETDMGDETLLKRCESFAQKENETPIIFIFDRDNKDIIKKATKSNSEFKSWGNNVYSFALPIPEHRRDWTEICIEHFFTDAEIKTEIDGKRLYLSNEFDENSGKLIADRTISLGNKGKIKNCCGETNYIIIDREVFDTNLDNVALSKFRFADYVRNSDLQSGKFEFIYFRLIFNIINSIVEEANPKIYLLIPGTEEFLARLHHKDVAVKAQNYLLQIEQIIRSVMQLFSIASIRFYEPAIMGKEGDFDEKVLKNAESAKSILKSTFTSPSLRTLYSLTKFCFHMISSDAKKEIKELKSVLETEFKLEELGLLIDSLEKIFPDEKRRTTYADKFNLKHSLFEYVFPKLIEFLSIDSDVMLEEVENYIEENELDFKVWDKGVLKLVGSINALYTYKFRIRSLQYIDRQTNHYVIASKTYDNGSIKFGEERIEVKDIEETEINISEMFVGETPVAIFPFFVVKDDALYSYVKQLGNGYEYYSISQDRNHIHFTKKKFNHSLFKSGSKQELFWVESPPVLNTSNGVKANVPSAGAEYFIGRKNQIKDIKSKILDIPNNNGIIYGPGGIGKTELLIQISEDLFLTENKDELHFDNIIWISAKKDFYDYIHNKIEKKDPQFRTLEHILVFILRFFDFEDVEEYDVDSAKKLVLDLLYDNRVLLILDNFETLTLTDQEKILDFFNDVVKSRLRKKPENFKLLISSREKVPGNFVPFQLSGLGLRETKLLAKKLFEKYIDSGIPDLTEVQKEELHKKSFGIPIVIKHFYAQIFDYSKSFYETAAMLGDYGAEIIQFSFKEILSQIEVKDTSQVQLRILLLLEIISYPLMVRQVADILGEEEKQIAAVMPVLLNYQCVKKINEHNFEKYSINDEIRLLTANLAQKYTEIVKEIRNNMIENFSVDKQLNYNQTELGLVRLFEEYISHEDFLEAEDLIKKSVIEHPESFLLKYHHARYLIQYRNKLSEAIEILEEIRQPSGNHPNILRLLFKSYIDLSEPNYERAHMYAQELEKSEALEEDFLEELAEFYVRWSTAIKVSAVDIDPIKELLRQGSYKQHAEKALDILRKIHKQSANIYYLNAQSYFNLWKDDLAKQNIDKAIKLAQKDPNSSTAQYEYFLDIIKKSKYKHSKKRSF
jgi:DNA replication protein DnaC